MKVTMGIIDKCWVHGDATLCVVIFCIRYSLPYLELVTIELELSASEVNVSFQ